MVLGVGLCDAIADFIIAVGGDEVEAAGYGVLRDRGQAAEGVVAIGGDFACLVGLRADATVQLLLTRPMTRPLAGTHVLALPEERLDLLNALLGHVGAIIRKAHWIHRAIFRTLVLSRILCL